MTLTEAKAILAGPLRFGDARQIGAARFFEEIEEVRAHIASCGDCLGNGRICFDFWCDGNGTDIEPAWNAAWERYFSQEAAEQALIDGDTHL